VNSAERSQLRQVLHNRCEAVADSWYEAITRICPVSHSAVEMRQRLTELTEQVIVLLTAEPFDQGRARAIGVSLACLNCIQPETLGRMQEVLACQLVEGLTADQVVALQPRLAAALGGLATGFFERAHEAILAEQEQIRKVLDTERQRAEDELNEYRCRLEELVEERTTELISAIEHLEQEITVRRRVEGALRDSEERLRLVVQNMPVMLNALDAQGNVIVWNRECERVTGYSPREIVDNPDALELLYPEVSYRERILAEPDERGYDFRDWEWEIACKDGSVKTVVWSDISRQFPIPGWHSWAIGVDVTERKRAEEALRQRNRELALLNRASQVLASTLDLDQVLVTVLEEVRRLMGVAACSVWLIEPETGELICQQATGPQSEIVRGWRLAPGDGLAGWVARSGESMIVPDAWTDDRHFRGVDRQIELELRSILSVPLRVKRGVIGVLQVLDTDVDRFDAADLTLLESLAAPAAIAIDNARLVEALRQRTAELEARNEDLDAFAHTVAHDLKNPLGLVIGFAEALGEEYATMPGEELRRYLHKIAQSGRKMSNIVDELLLWAGVRKVKVEARPLDMAGIVAEAQQRLAPMIEEYQGEIISPDTWPVALGYGPWIEEVWVNYLNNALKYGGRPPRVELGATVQSDGGVCFWVRDNGPGLTLEEQARLFTPFTRLNEVRTKGHGLGLSIARRIVEKLGGSVDVESEVGQGSVFTFTLPVAVLDA
jgi:PAS domain S-box-containing protein